MHVLLVMSFVTFELMSIYNSYDEIPAFLLSCYIQIDTLCHECNFLIISNVFETGQQLERTSEASELNSSGGGGGGVVWGRCKPHLGLPAVSRIWGFHPEENFGFYHIAGNSMSGKKYKLIR